MIARLAKTALWLLLGHAMLGGIYWGLLNVPESNVLMLASSALLALVVVTGAAIVQGVAVRSLTTGLSPRSVRTLISTGVPAFIVSTAIWIGCSWLAGWFDAWHTQHSGEIDAWLIAHGDWTRTAWLHRAVEVVLWFVRYVAGLSLAVGVFVVWVVDGLGQAIRPRRIAAALNWKRLLIVTGAVAGLMWLPWQAVSWRPASLPPSVVQPLFAAVKLGLIALVVHVGWALVLWSAIPRPSAIPSPAIDQGAGSLVGAAEKAAPS
jgi:hypothetical protein